MTEAQTWSPPTSRFATGRDLLFKQSVLSLDDGVLTWSPAGINRSGSKAFRLTIGEGAGQVKELAWVHGKLAYVRSGPGAVNILAFCAPAASNAAAGTRQVLGLVPVELVKPYNGIVDPGDSDARIGSGARAIAEACGLVFTDYEVPFDTDPNLLFPGVMPGARWVLGQGRSLARQYLVFGLGMLVAAVVVAMHRTFSVFGLVLLIFFGTLLSALGWHTLPSRLRRVQRRASKPS